MYGTNSVPNFHHLRNLAVKFIHAFIHILSSCVAKIVQILYNACHRDSHLLYIQLDLDAVDLVPKGSKIHTFPTSIMRILEFVHLAPVVQKVAPLRIALSTG